MSTNGLVPFDYDDPRRPRGFFGDDEDGLLGGYGDDVPRGTMQPTAPSVSNNIQPKSSPATGNNGEGSEAAAAEVGGLGPVPGTYVAQPQNGRPTLAMIPQKQEDLGSLVPQAPLPAQGQPQPT